ncbi:MAG TPA: glycosyltransferase family 9 protein [Steroidobacteraceae bacterium]|nr:glycosyltransferase family 9 protein [Steroidobacteraceae bacterium]
MISVGGPARALQPVVILFGRVGDMIMLTSALSLLHQRFGVPCQVVGAGPWNRDLYRGHPDVARCWSLPRHLPFAATLEWLAVVRALRRAAPAPVYILETMPRQLARIKRLLALSRIDQTRCVYPDESPREGGHYIDALLRMAARTPPILAAADYPAAGALRGPRLVTLATERSRRDALLQQRGWSGRPLVLIQPGTARTISARSRKRWRRDNDRSWPIERWRELLHALRCRHPQALLVLRGAVSELPFLREMRTAIGLEGLEVAGLGLRASFALMEAAESMISMDTGMAHAAAALGLPVVVLMGSNPQSRVLPRSASGSAVVGVGGPPFCSRADQIPVPAVLDAWCSLPARRAE